MAPATGNTHATARTVMAQARIKAGGTLWAERSGVRDLFQSFRAELIQIRPTGRSRISPLSFRAEGSIELPILFRPDGLTWMESENPSAEIEMSLKKIPERAGALSGMKAAWCGRGIIPIRTPGGEFSSRLSGAGYPSR